MEISIGDCCHFYQKYKRKDRGVYRGPFQHQKRSLTHLIVFSKKRNTFVYMLIITHLFENFNTFLKNSLKKFFLGIDYLKINNLRPI